MTNLDKSPAPYARLPEDPSQDESGSSNPFINYTAQKPETGAPADLAQQMQQLHSQPQAQVQAQPQAQGASITMMVGNSPQQVLLPPGFALVPGPNGQLTLQPFPAAQAQAQPQQQWNWPGQAPVPGLGPVQVRQLSPHEFDEGGFLALKVWLIILMISSCGSALFSIINGITYDEGGIAAMCIPQLYIFYCLLVLFQAMASRSFSKAKLAFMLLSILQGIMLISYIILVTALVYPRDVGFVSGIFWSSLIIFDASVYWGSYQVKKALQGQTGVYPSGQVPVYQAGQTYQTGQAYQTGQVFQA